MSIININKTNLLPYNVLPFSQVGECTNAYEVRKREIEDLTSKVDEVINNNIYEKMSSTQGLNQKSTNLLNQAISYCKNFFHRLDQLTNPLSFLGVKASPTSSFAARFDDYTINQESENQEILIKATRSNFRNPSLNRRIIRIWHQFKCNEVYFNFKKGDCSQTSSDLITCNQALGYRISDGNCRNDLTTVMRSENGQKQARATIGCVLDSNGRFVEVDEPSPFIASLINSRRREDCLDYNQPIRVYNHGEDMKGFPKTSIFHYFQGDGDVKIQLGSARSNRLVLGEGIEDIFTQIRGNHLGIISKSNPDVSITLLDVFNDDGSIKGGRIRLEEVELHNQQKINLNQPLHLYNHGGDIIGPPQNAIFHYFLSDGSVSFSSPIRGRNTQKHVIQLGSGISPFDLEADYQISTLYTLFLRRRISSETLTFKFKRPNKSIRWMGLKNGRYELTPEIRFYNGVKGFPKFYQGKFGKKKIKYQFQQASLSSRSFDNFHNYTMNQYDNNREILMKGSLSSFDSIGINRINIRLELNALTCNQIYFNLKKGDCNYQPIQRISDSITCNQALYYLADNKGCRSHLDITTQTNRFTLGCVLKNDHSLAQTPPLLSNIVNTHSRRNESCLNFDQPIRVYNRGEDMRGFAQTSLFYYFRGDGNVRIQLGSAQSNRLILGEGIEDIFTQIRGNHLGIISKSNPDVSITLLDVFNDDGSIKGGRIRLEEVELHNQQKIDLNQPLHLYNHGGDIIGPPQDAIFHYFLSDGSVSFSSPRRGRNTPKHVIQLGSGISPRDLQLRTYKPHRWMNWKDIPFEAKIWTKLYINFRKPGKSIQLLNVYHNSNQPNPPILFPEIRFNNGAKVYLSINPIQSK